MQQMYAMILTGIFLILCSIEDIRTRKIPVWIILAFGTMGILGALAGEHPAKALIMGLIPGFLLLGFGYVTGWKAGSGDGLSLLVVGSFMGAVLTLRIFMTGLFISAIYAIFLIVIKKAGRRNRLPFIPFLTAGFSIEMIPLIQQMA